MLSTMMADQLCNFEDKEFIRIYNEIFVKFSDE